MKCDEGVTLFAARIDICFGSTHMIMWVQGWVSWCERVCECACACGCACEKERERVSDSKNIEGTCGDKHEYMSVCICASLCMYIYMYICIYASLCMYIYPHIHTNIHTCIYINIYICMHDIKCMYIHTNVHTDEHMNTHLCIRECLYAYMIHTSHVPCVQYMHFTRSGACKYR